MDPLKYPCLILDHDNTVVRTSPDIQYPAFLHSLKCAGLDFSLSEREFLLIEYEGLPSFIREHFHLTPKMFQKIDDGWFDYMSRHTAKIYDGMAEVLQRHRAAGGIITVVTHSPSSNVLRDYKAADLAPPDIIIDASQVPYHNKPRPWPVETICLQLQLQHADCLVVDDKPCGLDMALRSHASCVVAGWGHTLPETRARIQQFYPYEPFLAHPSDLISYLFRT